MQAQRQKNAIIVPSGAKGGFVIHKERVSKEEFSQVYATYIHALLDMVDNVNMQEVRIVNLSGGSTPRALYALLASPAYRDLTDWSRWHVYFGDERCVPQDHPDSNFRMARETLLDHVPIPRHHVHPMVVAPADPDAAARAYEALLRSEVTGEDGIPVLDLALLGLGEDGHTASLFPGTPILQERERLVAPVYVERLASWRVSLTYPMLDAARHLLFLAAGEGKRPVLDDLRNAPTQTAYPVQGLAPQGTVEWYLDRAAAGGEQA